MSKPPSKKVTSKSAQSAGKKAASKPASKGAVWTFPEHTLEEAIAVAKAIDEKNGGNPMSADLLAKAVGLNKPDWRFVNSEGARRSMVWFPVRAWGPRN